MAGPERAGTRGRPLDPEPEKEARSHGRESYPDCLPRVDRGDR